MSGVDLFAVFFAVLYAAQAAQIVTRVRGSVTCSHLIIATDEYVPGPGSPPSFWYLTMSVLKNVYAVVSRELYLTTPDDFGHTPRQMLLEDISRSLL